MNEQEMSEYEVQCEDQAFVARLRMAEEMTRNMNRRFFRMHKNGVEIPQSFFAAFGNLYTLVQVISGVRDAGHMSAVKLGMKSLIQMLFMVDGELRNIEARNK